MSNVKILELFFKRKWKSKEELMQVRACWPQGSLGSMGANGGVRLRVKWTMGIRDLSGMGNSPCVFANTYFHRLRFNVSDYSAVRRSYPSTALPHKVGSVGWAIRHGVPNWKRILMQSPRVRVKWILHSLVSSLWSGAQDNDYANLGP